MQPTRFLRMITRVFLEAGEIPALASADRLLQEHLSHLDDLSRGLEPAVMRERVRELAGQLEVPFVYLLLLIEFTGGLPDGWRFFDEG